MLFVDSQSNVDKEALREHGLKKLSEFKTKITAALYGTQEKEYWARVHDQIGSMAEGEKKQKWKRVENQVIGLDKFIDGWINTALESPERFEFFVLAKAEEISSGDQRSDYFWALQIRHDQLVALIEVLEPLVEKVASLVKEPVENFFQDRLIESLGEKSVEDRLYWQAVRIKEDREKVV